MRAASIVGTRRNRCRLECEPIRGTEPSVRRGIAVLDYLDVGQRRTPPEPSRRNLHTVLLGATPPKCQKEIPFNPVAKAGRLYQGHPVVGTQSEHLRSGVTLCAARKTSRLVRCERSRLGEAVHVALCTAKSPKSTLRNRPATFQELDSADPSSFQDARRRLAKALGLAEQ